MFILVKDVQHPTALHPTQNANGQSYFVIEVKWYYFIINIIKYQQLILAKWFILLIL